MCFVCTEELVTHHSQPYYTLLRYAFICWKFRLWAGSAFCRSAYVPGNHMWYRGCLKCPACLSSVCSVLWDPRCKGGRSKEQEHLQSKVSWPQDNEALWIITSMPRHMSSLVFSFSSRDMRQQQLHYFHKCSVPIKCAQHMLNFLISTMGI